MSTPDKELVERLRAIAMGWGAGFIAGDKKLGELSTEAADSIETLQRDNEALRDALERAGGDAKLAADALGNSDERFRSCEGAFRIIEERCCAALLKGGGVSNDVGRPFGQP